MDTSSESPVAVLFDVDGNPVSVMQDGSVRRLQVEALLSSGVTVSLANVVSANNSSTVVPAVASPYIGTAEDVLGYAEITVTLASAQSAPHTGNLYFEFSPNGTNWDISVPIYYDSSDGFVPLPLRIVSPWYRLRYTPADDNLTAFRLTTLLHRSTPKHLTRLLTQPMRYNEPVEAARAVIAGASPTGDFLNVPTDSLGRLTITDGSEFARLLSHKVENTEEIRLDMEATADDHYIGYAVDGSAESDPVWRIVRIYLSATKEQTRMRFRQNIRWDQRTAGW